MKNNTTAVMDFKAVEYLSTKSSTEVKKILYGMTLLDGEQKLSDSSFDEVRAISDIYDGYIITAKAAKELASKLMKLYAAKNPRVFLTKKEFEAHTNVWYRKLYEAKGILGFEFVLETLRIGKARVKDPANGISEKDLLRALRWVEQREGLNKESSDRHHRKKGLELLGFIGFEEVLLDVSMVIANLYELVTPKNESTTEFPEVKEVQNEAKDEIEPVQKPVQKTVREMKIHFIQKAELILGYYADEMPKAPEGYDPVELQEDEALQAFARRGLMKDSEAIVRYLDEIKAYTDLCKSVFEEFDLLEQDAIVRRKDEIQKLISNEW